MSPALKLPRFVALLGILAVGSLLPASASASDTFVLDNQSKVATLQGASLWGKGHTMSQKCRTGPFPGPTEWAFWFYPGNTGSITLSQAPFTDCLQGINPLADNPVISSDLTNAEWSWIPVDPFVGYATLHCWSEGGYGTQALSLEVDGLTCTASDVAPGGSGSFSSSAAPIRGNAAVAFMQHSPGEPPAASPGEKSPDSGRYELILRSDKGNVHGRTTTRVVSGTPRTIRVPISGALRKQVAKSKKNAVKVEATLRRLDGKGTGDRATLTVMKDSKSLPF